MRGFSVVWGMMLFICVTTGSVSAQDCAVDDECTVSPLLKCLDGTCVECIDDGHCLDALFCNGIETCVDNVCVPGVSPCSQTLACDEETGSCIFGGQAVSMDIKPGSCQNPLNIGSRGVLPVMIYGSGEFDVSAIDPASILLTRDGYEGVTAVDYGYEDAGTALDDDGCVCYGRYEEGLAPDGFMDLKLKFRVPDLAEGLGLVDSASGETVLLVMHGASDAVPFMGQDSVRIINKPNWRQFGPKKPKKPKRGGKE